MRQTFPLAGTLLAVVTFIALLLLGVDSIIAFAVLIVWVGSLLITSGRPPETAPPVVEDPLSRNAIRRLIENSATPLMVTDRNTIGVANRAAREILGDHIVGQDTRVTFRQPEAIALLNRDRNGQAIVRGLVRRQDIWKFSRHAIDDQFAVIELVNQSAEADISRAHTDFVANASHELRTPLAAIIGYVETLSETPDNLDTPTARKFLGIIEREAHRLQSLISDLMSLSRVEAEKHDLPQAIVELAPLIERAAGDAAGADRIDRVRIEIAEPSDVRGDSQQLEQVVRNLVDNALKYGSPDTDVDIVLDRSRDGQARISVSDRGEGIAPDQLPHLTRRFYRTDPGRSRASGGTGLGLAIVKHIVERHRGKLDIGSELGKGTQVIIRIPSVEKDAASRENDPSANGVEKETGGLS